MGLNFNDYNVVDEDLCIFKNFPHKNAIFPLIYPQSNFSDCVILWLIKYRNVYSNHLKLEVTIYKEDIDLFLMSEDSLHNKPVISIIYKFNQAKFYNCNFSYKFEKCFNKSQTHGSVSYNLIYDETYEDYLIIYFEFITKVIISPIFSVAGAIFNIIILRILKNKNNRKLFTKSFLNTLR